MLQLPVYMDNHATTACDPAVVEAMIPYFSERYGNASSKGYLLGWQSSEAVQIAREQTAALINSEPEEIVFTSGATESINLAIKGVFETYNAKGKHIITVSTEHRAVLETCRHQEKMGAEISYLPVDDGGMIDLEILKTQIRKDTLLIAVMSANNETGVLQPIAEIGRIARENGVIFFTDATQSLGKVSVDVNRDKIDLLAGSAHKFYGPKGVGFLFVRRKNPKVRLSAQLDGGHQERGIRSGTLNVPGIAGLGKAAELALAKLDDDRKRIGGLRDQLEEALLKLENTRLNGNAVLRLAGVSNISFGGLPQEGLIGRLQKEIAVSSGSACSSGLLEPSHVLLAMGVSEKLARHSIRFSLGRFNTKEEVEFVIERVYSALKQIREFEQIRI